MRSLGWANLISWNGGQEKAFEELCCQLARREPAYQIPGNQYVRNGTPDGGVECFWKIDGKDIHGWQSKFFRGPLEGAQFNQIQKSFEAAIRSFPLLRSYIVCLPLNLPNAREARKKSARDRWEEHRATWKRLGGGLVEIILWDETALFERLARVTNTGLCALLFGTVPLSPDWFREHAREALANVGLKYRPAFDVNAGDRAVFDGIALTHEFRNSVLQASKSVKSEAIKWIEHDDPEICALAENASLVAAQVETWAQDGTAEFNYGDVGGRATRLSGTAEGLLPRCSMYWPLTDLSKVLCSRSFAAAAARCLLVTGEAGSGKTHFLSWAVDQRAKRGAGTVFLQGHVFGTTPNIQFARLVGLSETSEDTFLGALNAYGERRGERALLIIDALNETLNPELWRRQLNGLLSRLRRFPHIAFIASIRSTYIDVVLPDGMDLQNLPFLEHRGFAAVPALDLVPFFLAYGLTPPEFPMPTWEFRNPLILHLLCGTAQRSGGAPDFASVTGTIDDYLKSINRELARHERVGYERRLCPVTGAVLGLASAMASQGKRWLRLEQANQIVRTAFRDSAKPFQALTELLREGILTADRFVEGESRVEGIGFPFERLGDYYIALAAIQSAISGGAEQLRTRWIKPSERGVREMISLLIAEKERIEPQQYCAADHEEAERLTLLHLTWRKRDSFTSSFETYLLDRINRNRLNEYAVPMLLAVGIDPDHPYNARWTDSVLANWTMPERDTKWSVPLIMGTRGGWESVLRRVVDRFRPIEVPETAEYLIGFLCGVSDLSGISSVRRALASKLLCWMLAVPDPSFRGWVWKALERLFRHDPGLACEAIRSHANSDDPTILEGIVSASASIYDTQPKLAATLVDAVEATDPCMSTFGPLICSLRSIFRMAGKEYCAVARSPKARLTLGQLDRLVQRTSGQRVYEDITTGEFAQEVLHPAVLKLCHVFGQTNGVDDVQKEVKEYVLRRTLTLILLGRRHSGSSHYWEREIVPKYKMISLQEVIGAIILRRDPKILDNRDYWRTFEQASRP